MLDPTFVTYSKWKILKDESTQTVRSVFTHRPLMWLKLWAIIYRYQSGCIVVAVVDVVIIVITSAPCQDKADNVTCATNVAKGWCEDKNEKLEEECYKSCGLCSEQITPTTAPVTRLTLLTFSLLCTNNKLTSYIIMLLCCFVLLWSHILSWTVSVADFLLTRNSNVDKSL